MDRGCLLAVQGEGMFGEDYQVFISDGPAVGQVLVLGRRDPAEGGKQGSIPLKIPRQPLLLKSYLFKKKIKQSIALLQRPLSAPRFAQPPGLNFGPILKWQCAAQEK